MRGELAKQAFPWHKMKEQINKDALRKIFFLLLYTMKVKISVSFLLVMLSLKNS
jgi:hypothetical protein